VTTPRVVTAVHGRNGVPVELVRVEDAAAGVVLVPGAAGIDERMRRYASVLAARGFDVAMPARWWRDPEGAPPMGDADQIAAAIARIADFDALADLGAARDLLPPGRPRFVLGFGVGGLHARMAACVVPGFAGAVDWGGRIVYAAMTRQKPAQPLDLLPGLACPLLCHFGEADPGTPPAQVEELRRRLAECRVATIVFTYAGCGDADADALGPPWEADSAALAWARTESFLDHLVGAAG
jgi:dienelactone hydrolase